MIRIGIVCLSAVVFHLPLGAQTQESARSGADPQLRSGLTYVGIDTDAGPVAALEVSYVGSTPRIWRAGVIGGVFGSVHGTFYGYGGLQLPVPLGWGLLARPSFAMGLYEKGRGLDLGHVMEFRSSFVLEHEISERLWVSVMYYHLSNASLGLRNPGLEAVGVAVGMPILGREN